MSFQNFRPSGFNVLPTVIKNLLIVNGLFFLATIVFELKLHTDLSDYLGLHYVSSDKFMPHQFITYMFMHGGFGHVFFNMFALWMFGNAIENIWGPKRFLIFYVVCGLGAALTHLGYTYFTMLPLHEFISHPTVQGYEDIFNGKNAVFFEPEGTQQFINDWTRNPDQPSYIQSALSEIELLLQIKADIPVVGASGCVFGILLAFGMMFPNNMIYIYFLFPIKAKYFVLIYGAIELFSGIADVPGDSTAHYAHLGGMLFGFILIKIWNRRSGPFY